MLNSKQLFQCRVEGKGFTCPSTLFSAPSRNYRIILKPANKAIPVEVRITPPLVEVVNEGVTEGRASGGRQEEGEFPELAPT